MLDTHVLWLVLYLLLLWLLVTYRRRLVAWPDLPWLGHQLQCEKRNRCSVRCPFPTKRPDCPFCQEQETAQDVLLPPEPPVIPASKRGRQRQIDTRVHFCPEDSCAYYGWLAKGNLTSNGFPNSGKNRQLRCKACEKLFCATTGTLFYGIKTSPETVLLTLKVLAEGLDLQATARVFEVKEATVQHCSCRTATSPMRWLSSLTSDTGKSKCLNQEENCVTAGVRCRSWTTPKW